MNHKQKETVFSDEAGEAEVDKMSLQDGTELRQTGEQSGMEFRQTSPMRKWLARLGVAGFMFFFLKGIVWLVVIFGVGKCVL